MKPYNIASYTSGSFQTSVLFQVFLVWGLILLFPPCIAGIACLVLSGINVWAKASINQEIVKDILEPKDD